MTKTSVPHTIHKEILEGNKFVDSRTLEQMYIFSVCVIIPNTPKFNAMCNIIYLPLKRNKFLDIHNEQITLSNHGNR